MEDIFEPVTSFVSSLFPLDAHADLHIKATLVGLGVYLLTNIVLGFVTKGRKLFPISKTVTMTHEGGHAFSALMVLSRVRGIVVNKDGSGHTITMSRGGVLRRLWTTFWGYPTPVVTGAALFALVAVGRIQIASFLVALTLGYILLKSRSIYSILSVITAVATLVALPYFLLHQNVIDDKLAFTIYAVCFGYYASSLIGGGLRMLFRMYSIHTRPSLRFERQNSDAEAMRNASGISSLIWLTLMFATAILSLYGSAVLIMDGLT